MNIDKLKQRTQILMALRSQLIREMKEFEKHFFENEARAQKAKKELN